MNTITQPEDASFFIVAAPGLEAAVQAELLAWCPVAEPRLVRGGLELQLPLARGFGLNRVLKTPTRILLRLMDFGCRDFPKLFKKISGFPWEEWLPEESQVVFQASSRQSRLRIKKRIEETCADGYSARLKKRGVKPANGGPQLSIFVRFDEDVCTVSFDSSGELLHKRGLRPMSSEAPLRETIAAALLRELASAAGPARGDHREVQLVDPMTGAATFLLEAAGLYRPVRSRGFAFEALAHGKNQSEELGTAEQDPYRSFLGYDLDQKALSSAAENWRLMSEARELELRCEDFFAAENLGAPSEPRGKQRWLIVNPPYGERIKIEGKLTDYYVRLAEASERVVRPRAACFLLPSKVRRMRWPDAWEEQSSLVFENGGIPVTAWFLRRRP